MKFGLIGALGTVVNLTCMALLIRATEWRDWRASALSTFMATVNNYSLNNVWTFQDRARTGSRFFSGYMLFLVVSLAGVLVTVSVYAGLARGLDIVAGSTGGVEKLSIWVLLSFQLFAILCGAYVNYSLNRAITWKN